MSRFPLKRKKNTRKKPRKTKKKEKKRHSEQQKGNLVTVFAFFFLISTGKTTHFILFFLFWSLIWLELSIECFDDKKKQNTETKRIGKVRARVWLPFRRISRAIPFRQFITTNDEFAVNLIGFFFTVVSL